MNTNLEYSLPGSVISIYYHKLIRISSLHFYQALHCSFFEGQYIAEVYSIPDLTAGKVVMIGHLQFQNNCFEEHVMGDNQSNSSLELLDVLQHVGSRGDYESLKVLMSLDQESNLITLVPMMIMKDDFEALDMDLPTFFLFDGS